MNFLPRSIYLALLLVFILPFAVTAQTPSRAATQPVVLNDMSERTGQTITINSMSFQQWFYGSYTFVRELGCPLAPASTPTSGNWQRFEFTYSGFVYIYLGVQSQSEMRRLQLNMGA